MVLQLTLLQGATPALAQSAVSAPAIRITEPVDDKSLVTLKGNVHPLARPQYDQGAAAAALPADRLTLVLKRGAAQQAALRQFLEATQDRKSPMYHKYLTPEQFGKQFGTSDADLQTVTNWLGSQGFSVAKVNKGRTAIEFSGKVDQVQKAFHTSIHSYVVNGEQHYANATDPSIPAALAPVVAGVARLNNFKPHSMIKLVGPERMDRATHKATPLFNDPSFNNDGSIAGYSLPLVPGDLSAIYDTKPLLAAHKDGTGVVIAVAGDSNINPSYVQNYRTNFLPSYTATTFSASNIIIDGNDPGPNGDDIEAYLDVEVAGGVAPNATVDLYIAASTNLSSGLELAMVRAIEDNTAAILNVSFGESEAQLLTAGNLNLNNLYEQAAAQGMTVLVASGDSGSAGADNPNSETAAINGLEVSGFASTPYNIAVGGTDFFYPPNVPNATLDTYWATATTANPGNNPDYSSALGPIPEKVWNDSSTLDNQFPASQANIVGGGGGTSNCADATLNSDFTITCNAGYAKPSWQVGTGVPADALRHIPDVSLFAADGLNFSYYAICAIDSTTNTVDCLPNGGSNSLTNPIQITGVGGTSASSPAMAGIMALIVQGYGRQGQANTVLYPLAAQQPTAFHDVTAGSNAVVCTGATLDCSSTVSGTSGFLNGYDAGTGYDQATGLGSVDANVLYTKWNSVVTTPTTTTLTVSPTTVNLGDNVTFTVRTVSSTTGIPTGDVALLTNSTTPAEGGQVVQTLPANSGTVTFTYAGLPGSGNPSAPYQVTARYAGDGTFAPSTSAPVTMTVNPAASKIYIDNANVYGIVNGVANVAAPLQGDTSVPYGAFVGFDSFPVPASYTVPTNGAPPTTVPARGTINITDNAVPLHGLALDAFGSATFSSSTSAPGPHSLIVSYAGDASYGPSTSAAPVTFAVVKAQNTLALSPSVTAVPAGGSVVVTAAMATTSYGNLPTGTVTFSIGANALAPVSITAGADPVSGAAAASAAVTIAQNDLPMGSNTITATYSGDGNYAASTAPGVTVTSSIAQVGDFTATGASIVFAKGTVPSGSSTVTVTPSGGFTGTVTFGACTLSAGFTGGTCAIDHPSVSITGFAAATAKITVSSANTTAQNAPRNQQPRWLATGGGLALAAILFFGIPARKRAWRQMLAVIFCLIAAAGLSACGGGSSGGSGGGGGGGTPPPATIPAGTYTATVTATSGTISHPITVSITVN